MPHSGTQNQTLERSFSCLLRKMIFSCRTRLEPDADCLDSWKEIAGYLRRTVRTAQRWERHEGLTVHRHRHKKTSSVYALKHEVDAWRKSRSPERADSATTGVTLGPAGWSNPTVLSGKQAPAVPPVAGPRSLLFVQTWDSSSHNFSPVPSLTSRFDFTCIAHIG